MTTGSYPYEANRRVKALISSLKTLVARDPEQEVQGPALQVLDAALDAIKAEIPDDPVAQSVLGIFTAEFIAAGEPVRAADMLVIAQQLNAAIGQPPPFVG